MHVRRAVKPASRPASARERIDQTVYELFSRHGIRAVGVDTISARSGVAKMTLYRHYPSKDDLALAFLRRREEVWTRFLLQPGTRPHLLAAAQEGEGEVILGGVVAIQSHLRHTRARADGINPYCADTVPGEELVHGLVDALARAGRPGGGFDGATNVHAANLCE